MVKNMFAKVYGTEMNAFTLIYNKGIGMNEDKYNFDW